MRSSFKYSRHSPRKTKGAIIIECLVSVAVAGLIMSFLLDSVTRTYRASSTNQNQVTASNLAQQVIDHARDMTYGDLLQLLGGDSSVTQTLSLYEANSAVTLFPRALARDQASTSDLAYSSAAQNNIFSGTVTATLTNLQPASNAVQVSVDVNWSDSTGPHTFSTFTQITEYGIHCY
jgi:hypothetical protein